uniref:Uncharacterized protein n=1 Tax=Siphoviridae sp. ct0uL16 TaxID=2825299 RepID=A0A8S5Q643_9CAUD|nr:MAG TPA: hypothetical protein [Siphoviridae sp. ct0uL16]
MRLRGYFCFKQQIVHLYCFFSFNFNPHSRRSDWTKRIM